jgi:hypothetical protein
VKLANLDGSSFEREKIRFEMTTSLSLGGVMLLWRMFVLKISLEECGIEELEMLPESFSCEMTNVEA